MTTDAELDRMYEIACAQDWEEQNTVNVPGWSDAIKGVESAEELLKEAAELLKEAAELLKESTESDRINSLSDEVEFLRKDAERQTERMKSA